MKGHEKKRLEAAGWKFGSAADFLGLAPDEAALVEVKLALAQGVKALRAYKRLSQASLAKLIRSSQSRVAKMEAGDPTVSVDLIMRTLLTMGASRPYLGKLISVRKVADVGRVRIRPQVAAAGLKQREA